MLVGRVAFIDDGCSLSAFFFVVASTEEILELVEEIVVHPHCSVQSWVVGGTQPSSSLFEDDENLTGNLEKLPLLATQLRDVGVDLHHLRQWLSELEGALDHVIGGVPARARVKNGLLPRNVALLTQGHEQVGTLRRRADPAYKAAELGDA